jgi:rhodanese-related sulfurtransferase
MSSWLRARGSAVGEAFLVVALGAALGVVLDLVLPRGVLRHSEAAVRDLEFLLPVYLHTPADVQRALDEGTIVLVDGRSAAEFAAKHPKGALSIPQDREEDLSDSLVAEFAGASLIVLLGEDDFEEARLYARDLAGDLGASRVGTIEGGFEAWERAGLETAGSAP